MAKFVVNTSNAVSKEMLEKILKEHLGYNIYVEEYDEDGFNPRDIMDNHIIRGMLGYY